MNTEGKSAINLEPEMICDHYVTSETKKLWNVLLDLHGELDRICKKYNIKYFAGGGTLLGCIRHKGFIPWDDDMDFFMLDEDYLKFCEVAPKEIKEPYFFQSYKSEGEVYWPDLVLLRRSDTTGCTERALEGYIPPANLGIFIDIFPLSNIPAKKINYELHSVLIKAYRKAIRGHERYLHAKYCGKLSYKNYLDSTFWAWKVMSIFSRNYTGLCKQFLNVLFHVKDSGYVGLKSYFTHNKKYVWPRKCFEEIIELPFENRLMPCPKGYDEVLRHQYGDYMKFVKGASQHTMTIVDTENSYKTKLLDDKGRVNI